MNLLKGLLSNTSGDVNVNYNESNASFKFENFTLICRLIDGKYPNEGLFPVGEISVKEKKKMYLCLLDILFIILHIVIYREIYRVIESYRLPFKKRNRCYFYGERNYHKNTIG